MPLLCKDNIGLVSMLETKHELGVRTRKLLVATTHLLFSHRREEVRLAQIRLLLAEIDRLTLVTSKTHPMVSARIPCILTGDFNSSPIGPGVFQFVSQGRTILSTDSKSVGCQSRDKCKQTEEEVLHGLELRPVYSHERDPPEVSTKHDKWIKVDYIFYSPGINLVARLALPSSQEAEAFGALPSEICPSDHFPLVADFQIDLTS